MSFNVNNQPYKAIEVRLQWRKIVEAMFFNIDTPPGVKREACHNVNEQHYGVVERTIPSKGTMRTPMPLEKEMIADLRFDFVEVEFVRDHRCDALEANCQPAMALLDILEISDVGLEMLILGNCSGYKGLLIDFGSNNHVRISEDALDTLIT